MKILGVLLCLCVSFARCDVIQDLSGRILELDQVFLQKGPTISILQNYDSIISEINKLDQTDESYINFEVKYLPNLYYKKGLIEFSIDKELFAIESFEKCYKLNKSFNPCKEKLVQLYLKNGKLNKLRQLSNESQIQETTLVEIGMLERAIEESQLAISSKDYSKCFEKLSEAIQIAPSYNDLRLKRINCLESISDFEPQLKLKTLIDDYSELIKNGQYTISTIEKEESGMFDKLFKKDEVKVEGKSLDNFVKLFKLLLFGSKEFDKSQKYLQKCLRVDNDYVECQQYSKLYVKLSKFWTLFEKISIYYSHVYFKRDDEEQVNQDDEFDIGKFEISPSEWEYVYNFLFNEAEILKLTKKQLQVFGLEKISNNFELIFHELNNFATSFKFVNDKLNLSSKIRSDFYNQNAFASDFLRLGIESIIMSNSNGKHNEFVHNSCICISSTVNEESKKFLPCEIVHIDRLLSKPVKRDYMKALKLLKSMGPRLRKTELWISRYKKIESKYPTEPNNRRQQQQHHRFNQQQQQQYQNSYQHQQFFNQQQQQQQQSPPQQFPDTDFYKVLEVPKTADEQTIKKAYREKVKQYHPDKNKNSEFNKEELEQKMSDINNAYEVLSDKQKKQQYDAQRQGHGQPRFRQQQQQQQQPRHHQQQQFFHGGAGPGADFFRNIFRQQNQNRRGPR